MALTGLPTAPGTRIVGFVMGPLHEFSQLAQLGDHGKRDVGRERGDVAEVLRLGCDPRQCTDGVQVSACGARLAVGDELVVLPIDESPRPRRRRLRQLL